MFGYFKRKKYEKDVRVFLHAMFADISGRPSSEYITPTLVESYGENWNAIIKDSISSGKTPELTALLLAVALFQDVLNNQVSEEKIIEIQKCILEEREDTNNVPIIFKLQFFIMVATTIENVGADHAALAIRDIHRAIFKNDDTNLNTTIKYLIDGGNHMKSLINGKRNV